MEADSSLNAFSFIPNKHKKNSILPRKPYSFSLNSKNNALPPLSSDITSPNNSNTSLYESKKRAKTQAISNSSEQTTPSHRQLSHFVFNHLQKKIQFEEKQYHKSSQTTDRDTINGHYNLDEQPQQQLQFIGIEKQYLYNSKLKPITPIYDYQNPRNKTQQIKLEEFLKPQKILKYKMKNRNRGHLPLLMNHRQRKDHTHIDSYFDLSCLQSLPKSCYNRLPQTSSRKNEKWKATSMFYQKDKREE